MRSKQEKDIFRDHAIEATEKLIDSQWEQHEIKWTVIKANGDEKKFSGVGKQEEKTPVKLAIDLLKSLDMRGKDTLIISNYDLFTLIKFLKRSPQMLPHLGLSENHVDYKTITFLTDSKELLEAPPAATWIEPNELVYVDNLADVATIEEALDNHTK
jgi:hypothetical protein